MQLVWFKRDLRVHDHAALCQALAQGPTLALYVIEPELWQQPTASMRHWQYTRQALLQREQNLRSQGGALCVRIGNAVEVFKALHHELDGFALHSHEETGNAWTFHRDLDVLNWCKQTNVCVSEYRQFGVFRRLQDRDGWSRRWRELMQQPINQLPDHRQWLTAASAPWHSWAPKALDHRVTLNPAVSAENTLQDFLQHRGERYHLEMSSPVTAPSACSRLSTHLAYGQLSMRQVAQQTWQRQAEIREQAKEARGTWPKALSAFQSRLHWHCHFIQKFESEPEIEFENMARSCDGLREQDFDSAKFEAWQTGTTGYPFVDACMRFLTATGWINFRMRAMLVSFAAYDLWLHWRQPAAHLAQLFNDYEPGIHYSQVQMQSGTTGINTLRIYNPVKQSLDQDPSGAFIRQWVPELQGFSDAHIHAPWTAPHREQLSAGCVIGKHYPAPIVDHAEASRFARGQLSAARKTEQGQQDKTRVLKKHGSRR